MRLKNKEIESIKNTVLSFDNKARIYLFGSRTDDTKKGGDIDLLVFSDKLSFGEKIKIKAGLLNRLGERKIDLIIARDDSKPFIRIALEKGVLL